MLALDSSRWSELKGGYKILCDPRPSLRALENGFGEKKAWDDLWQELHHQGDLGDASYAAVPQLVHIHCDIRPLGWNVYALVSCIELERHRKTNPVLPDWLRDEYREACERLLCSALETLRFTKDDMEFRSALGFVPLARGWVKLGAILTTSDQSELDQWAEETLAWTKLYF